MTPAPPSPTNRTQRPLYNLRPDYARRLPEVPEEARRDLLVHLERLYGAEEAGRWLPELERVVRVHDAHKSQGRLAWEASYDTARIFSERDMIVITYGDMLEGDGQTPLRVLTQVCNEHMKAPNTVHILPFFPYSSDRGFAVVDFERVDPRLGDWSDIRGLAGSFKLMFDGVLNHASSRSRLFQDFLDGRAGAQGYFIAYDSPDELTPDQRSKIFRPRTSDILTRFDTYNGAKWLWTTFSDDQIDLNYRNPEVLLAAVEALLLYVRMGADLLRLDAVTYIWAEPGTECVHLPQTHEVVKLLRTVLDLAAPGTAIITETNVPHADNISYFGDGFDEAHLVYNFALPPLTLYTMFTGDAGPLSRWAAAMEPPSDQTHFFNILDTHDGIGLMGARGILEPEQIELIIDRARANGALVSMKTVEGGGQEPYEINSTWWSVLNPPESGEDPELQVARYAASRSVNLVLKGVPGIYLHGALGTENDWCTCRETGHARDLNRATVKVDEVFRQASRPQSRLGRLTALLVPMQVARVTQRAFHPRGGQRVLALDWRVLAVLRTSPEETERVLCLTSVVPEARRIRVGEGLLGGGDAWRDILGGGRHRVRDGELVLELAPYQVAWLRWEG